MIRQRIKILTGIDWAGEVNNKILVVLLPSARSLSLIGRHVIPSLSL